MKLEIYQIDAFANNVFQGNPAAVCPLESWLDDSILQAIASENNLSETAFFVRKNDAYEIRWFTPVKEVDLCGHATLASAFVIFDILGEDASNELSFNSRSGQLKVKRQASRISMDFPAQPGSPVAVSEQIRSLFDFSPLACLKSEDYIIVADCEQTVADAVANYELLKQLDLRGVIITAPSEKYDFVSRFFAPKYGILEDPVTGSSFTQLVPYWAERLQKTNFHAKQISKRGGEVYCQHMGQRVQISGAAVLYLSGVIEF